MAKHKTKATRNRKGCGLCKPYKRAGNASYRYSAKEAALRDIQDEYKFDGPFHEDPQWWLEEMEAYEQSESDLIYKEYKPCA